MRQVLIAALAAATLLALGACADDGAYRDTPWADTEAGIHEDEPVAQDEGIITDDSIGDAGVFREDDGLF